MPSGQNPALRGQAPPVSGSYFDGPGSEAGRSRSGSRTRSQGSATRDSSANRPAAVPAGYDTKSGRAPVLNRNVDFGGMAYLLRNGVVSHLHLLHIPCDILRWHASCPSYVG